MPLRPLLALVISASFLAMNAEAQQESQQKRFPWAGEGDYRILLRVDDDSREGDLRPADLAIDFAQLLSKQKIADRRPDLNTLQVIRHDAETGKPRAVAKQAFGRGKFDSPFRWYDDEIGYEFPEVFRAVNYTKEQLVVEKRTRFGYFFDCIGDWRKGRLAFTHRQQGAGPAWYGVYFQLLPKRQTPRTVPPRGLLGDGLSRCLPQGDSSTGLIHSRIETVDFNEDGLFDLLVGCGRGGLVWYPNTGRAGKPSFPYSKLVRTVDGRALDCGVSAAPKVVDWNRDGLFDLLVGVEWNRILLFLNKGRKGEPEFAYEGPVRTPDGELLTLPFTPVEESPGVFLRDYYPLLDTPDWDGDGDWDLLAGGYVTGRVYLFENTGEAGRPHLTPRGPLLADGKPLDVQWCAAPAVADLDDDGDLDLVVGSLKRTKGGGDDASRETFLIFYRNDGTRREPKLTRATLPHTGRFPRAGLTAPRLIDWTGDGVLDLIVSAQRKIFMFRNEGTAKRPRFEAHERFLPSRWSGVRLNAAQMIDWNRDGLLDIANGPRIQLNTGRGSPGIFESKATSLIKPGQVISHLSGIGDDWRFQRLFDFDRDGSVDLLDADHGGHVWWHRNRGTNQQPDLETEGHRFARVDGQPVRVGLNRAGFDALQGARTTYTVADFDGDDLNDLVVADNFGIVRFFRQAKTESGPPRFDPPVKIAKLRIRCVPYAADWNGDGRVDVIAGSSTEDVVVMLNRGKMVEGSPLLPGRKLKLPSAPYGAGTPLLVADFDHDGDTDLLINTAYGYTCFFERTFIEKGYAKAKIVRLETR